MHNKMWKVSAVFFCMMTLLTACTRKDNITMIEPQSTTTQTLQTETISTKKTEENVTMTDTDEPKELYLHICGAVQKPGVYRLENGDRIYQAILAAGGFREDAYEDYVNQAQKVEDGGKLWIPTNAEAKEQDLFQKQRTKQETGLAGQDAKTDKQEETATQKNGQININLATETELCSLKGIGVGKAQSIIKYRELHGSFQKKEDIMKVSGIKQAGFQKIEDSITVN